MSLVKHTLHIVGLPIGHAVRGLCGSACIICGYAAIIGEKLFRGGGFLDFRRLGILPWVVVLTSYVARHRIFLSWVC